MATSNSPHLKNYKGHKDKTVVVKQYNTQTVITSYPDRTNVVYTENQEFFQSRFADAVAWAGSIVRDPVKKAEYSKLLPKGKRLYNAAIQEYLNPQQQPFSNIKPPVKKRGRINKGNVLIKDYRDKAVVTSVPDMSHVVHTEKQKKAQCHFAEAVAYAQAIIADPVQKAAYQKNLPKGKKVYHAALKEYLNGTMPK